MADPRWENLKDIFHAAVALAPGERGAYLDRACDANASLRQAVDSRLMRQKFAELPERSFIYEFESIGDDGPVLRTSTIEALDSQAKQIIGERWDRNKR